MHALSPPVGRWDVLLSGWVEFAMPGAHSAPPRCLRPAPPRCLSRHPPSPAGRVDDVINVSGHRIGTAEVESALVAHPQCAEAAVVGYEHPVKGQGIWAYVTLLEVRGLLRCVLYCAVLSWPVLCCAYCAVLRCAGWPAVGHWSVGGTPLPASKLAPGACSPPPHPCCACCAHLALPLCRRAWSTTTS